MEKILVSACLLGQPVRYNGRGLNSNSEILEHWLKEGRVVATCPEVSVGLPVPRAAAEIRGGNGEDVLQNRAEVTDKEGQNYSRQFIEGAEVALKLCRDNQIRLAILTESSPSCGSSTIYNGEFSGVKIDGVGVTSALLAKSGIKVFSQHTIPEAADYLERLEQEKGVS